MSMIEVLVALAVVGTLVLGLGAGLGRVSTGERHAGHRAVAVAQAQVIADQMRSNPAGAIGGHYRLDQRYADIAVAPSDPACLDSAGPCSPGVLAAAALATWNLRNAALLPGGRGAVAPVAGGHVISLMWRDAALAAAARPDPECAAKSPPEAVPGVRCIHRHVAQ